MGCLTCESGSGADTWADDGLQLSLAPCRLSCHGGALTPSLIYQTVGVALIKCDCIMLSPSYPSSTWEEEASPHFLDALWPKSCHLREKMSPGVALQSSSRRQHRLCNLVPEHQIILEHKDATSRAAVEYSVSTTVQSQARKTRTQSSRVSSFLVGRSLGTLLASLKGLRD